MAGVVGMALDTSCYDYMRRAMRTLQPVRGDAYGNFLAPIGMEIEEGDMSDLFDGIKGNSFFREGKTAIGSVGYHENSKPVLIKTSNLGPFAVAGDVTIVNRDELQKKFPYLVGPDIRVCAGLIASGKNPVDGLKSIFDNVKGRCNLVVFSLKHGLFAYRDRWGFRSFTIARGQEGCGVSSESASLGAAFDETRTNIIRDVYPAEVVKIENTGFRPMARFEPWQRALCPFDIGYTHNSASISDGVSVGLAKYNMGLALAEEYPVTADIVSSFPQSGIGIAEGTAVGLGIPIINVFQYLALGRSFLPSLEAERKERGRLKLPPVMWVLEEFKNIVLGDDSIVEGNQFLRRLMTLASLMTHIHGGAKNFALHARIGCLQKKYGCLFKPEQTEKLFASTRDKEVMRKELLLNSLEFNSQERFLEAVMKAQIEIWGERPPHQVCDFCTCCFENVDMQEKYFDFSITV